MFYKVKSYSDLTVKALLILFPYAFPLHRVQKCCIQNKTCVFVFSFLKSSTDSAGALIWVKSPLICAQHDTVGKHIEILQNITRVHSPLLHNIGHSDTEQFLIRMLVSAQQVTLFNLLM